MMASSPAISGLACPKCGGMVPIPEGVLVAICPFCDQRSLVQGERGFRRYQISRKTERADATKALRSFFGNWAVARDLPRNARVTEMFCAYLPFWAMWTHGLGWAFGEEKVGSGNDARYVPREIEIGEDLVWAGAACDVGEFGVERIDLANCPLEPFRSEALHADGMVFEPVGSVSDAQASAKHEFDKRVRKKARLHRQTQLMVRFVNNRFGLVYYPLWVIRYQYRGRNFQVVVDGYNGKVLYGKAPGNTFYRAAVLVGGMALGAFLAIDGAAFALSMASGGDEDGFGFVLLLLAVGFGMMAMAYRTYRYGEQYEFGGSKKFDPKLAVAETPGEAFKIAMRVVGIEDKET